MKQFLNALRRKLRGQLIPVLAVVAAIGLPVAIMAWGPNRDTFTAANPANRVIFNSITDNPEVGDERNFLNIKDASDTAPGNWKNDLTVTPGKEYLMRVYVHNDAAAHLNLKATNTRVKVSIPTHTAKEIGMSGFVTADNANPKEVWADAVVRSNSDFNIAYVNGSARLYNKHFGQTGAQLSDDIVTSKGALVGYDKLDGIVPGCLEYSGYVTFKVRIQGPSEAKFDFNKEVRKAGSTDKFTETIATKPGDKVEFRISYKNTSQVTMNNVLVKDTLPQGLTYVPGTAKMYNANYPYPNGWQITEDLFKGGSNIGAYGPGANALVVFTAQVAGNEQLPKCGPNTLRNVAKVETDYGQKEDGADVTVPKECQPEAKVTCEGLSVIERSPTQFTFQGDKIVENAEFVKYVYTVRNEAGQVVKTIESTTDQPVPYENATPGKYKVKVEVIARINGTEQSFSDAKCEQPFEVKKQEEKAVYVCEYLRLIEKTSRDTFVFEVKADVKGPVSIKEYKIDFGDTQTETFGLGKEVRTHTYKTPGEYTAQAWVTFELKEGKTETKTGESCKVTLTVETPPVVPPTPEKPETPEELPSTGPEALLAGIVGSSALGYGVHAFATSRRKLAAAKASR